MTPDAQLLAELRRYYDGKGIGASSFRCRHFAHCRSLSPQFTTAQETYVGPRYADGTHPRLLFLSLDSPTLEADACERTLERVRARTTLRWDIRTFHKRHQWRQTNELALVLMRHFVPALTLETAVRYFAHANSAKCCVHNADRSQAPVTLFNNCREFIPGELRILNPDILVTQGDHAKRFGEAFPPIARPKGACEKCQSRIIAIGGGHKTLWLHCYHTGARGGMFLEQKERCWPHYEHAVVEFVSGELSAPDAKAAPSLPAPREDPPLPATAHHETPADKDIFVWVNSCDAGWVIHGRARSSEARAREGARILTRGWGWEALAAGARPAPKPPRSDAPPAEVAMHSPASPQWRK